jgi:hypothetical protein
MISVSTHRYLRMFVEVAVFALLTVAALALLSVVTGAQTTPRGRPQQPAGPTALPAAQIEEPLYREYRGVQIGMSKDQARQKLGTPGDVSDRQDFFNLSGTESAQVFYDATGRVSAVSVNYLGEGSNAPSPEKVYGTPVAVNDDGSIYKLVRYERAGYLVVYSRSGGDAPPLVTVTMQKLVN